MTAILLALGSSVGYGVSDLLASRVAKRVAPVPLVLYSQALQSVVLLVVVLRSASPTAGRAWPGGRPPGRCGPGAGGASASTPRPDHRASRRPQTAGAALAVLGTLVVPAAQAAG